MQPVGPKEPWASLTAAFITIVALPYHETAICISVHPADDEHITLLFNRDFTDVSSVSLKSDGKFALR